MKITKECINEDGTPFSKEQFIEKIKTDNDFAGVYSDAYKNYAKYVKTIVEGYMDGDIIGSQPHIEKLFSNPDELTILTKEEFINKIKTDDEFAKRWG